jgi:cytochrome c oxidase subunit IV
MAGRHFLYGLELAGPYMMLLGASVYALVAWGLFRLQSWARWTAMLLIVISTASLIPKISMAELGVPILWYGLQIALRVATGWYLAQAPAVIDAFAEKR